MTIKKIVSELMKRQKELAATRDKLRDLYNDVDQLLDDSNTALQDLESCIEKLSEQQ